MQVLVLNLTYEFLQIVDMHKAIKLLVKEKAEVVEPAETGKTFKVKSRDKDGTWIEKILSMPSVIRLLQKVEFKKKPISFTRRRVFIRDKFTCQYCGANSVKMTIDHIHPQAQGGRSTWENCVAACIPCNKVKADHKLDVNNSLVVKVGNKTVTLRLRRPPQQPSFYEFIRLSPAMNNPKIKEKWGMYLFQGA